MADVIAVVKPSAMRRVLGVFAIGALGVLLVYIAFMRPPDRFGWQAFLLIFGGATLWASVVMWRASAYGLEMTADGLRSQDGRVIAAFDNIKSVDRSFFAFKPSNGFLVRLYKSPGRAWAPGIWWRIGRSVGVGGVTTASEAKFMAEILTAQLAQRDAEQDQD